MQPALEEMGRALNEMRPMAEQLLKLIDDIGNYEAPVVLANGDILIRRKPERRPPRPGPSAGRRDRAFSPRACADQAQDVLRGLGNVGAGAEDRLHPGDRRGTRNPAAG